MPIALWRVPACGLEARIPVPTPGQTVAVVPPRRTFVGRYEGRSGHPSATGKAAFGESNQGGRMDGQVVAIPTTLARHLRVHSN